MKKILEYKIVKGDHHWISGRITVYLSEGWELYGNPYGDSDKNHCQAIVKYVENIESTQVLND